MKKIMFNDRYGLTQAVIDGRKTMTRRLIHREFFTLTWDTRGNTLVYENACGDFIDIRDSKYCPYKVGDVVAVAQSYQDAGFGFASFMYGYIASEKRMRVGSCDEFAGWGNKMFVHAYIMPHQIRITDVRCERLQDISDSECLREGVQYIEELGVYYFERPDREGFYFDTPRAAFASLIDKVSGKGTWDSNPWIIVYEFELVKK